MKIAKVGICSHGKQLVIEFGIMPWNPFLLHVRCGVVKGLKHGYSRMENFRFCGWLLAVWIGFSSG